MRLVVALAVALAVAILAAASMLVIARRESGKEPPSVVQSDVPTRNPADEALRAVREPLPEQPVVHQTLRQSLSELWGEDFLVVQARAEALGIDLERPFTSCPWQEVEDKARQELTTVSEKRKEGIEAFYKEWPRDLTLAWAKEHFHLPETFSDADLLLLDDMARQENEEISMRVDQFCYWLQGALLNQFDRGGYDRALFSTDLIPFERDTADAFYSRAASLPGGWCAKISLRSSDYPEIEALADEIQTMQLQRDAKLRAALRSWPPR